MVSSRSVRPLQEVLGAAGQREREGQRARGFDGGGDALGGQAEIEDRRVLAAGGVFDRAADQARLRRRA